ncbi:coiled-coil domain-containing protein lost boys [Cochliomyia hominivorax]
MAYISKAKIKIDLHKYDDELKAIEKAHRVEEIEAECDEEEYSYKEGDEEDFDGLDFQPIQAEDSFNVGRIDLSFPETIEEFQDSVECYPPSYYTLSAKERVLLLYAENFRNQFVIRNSKRRPLVLAVPNECKVQKFVCTTIRPTAFLYTPLIRNAEECASFVADFIVYEPLDDMMSFPTRLVSPSTLLRRRRGNSFEMATLLCSMLIGSGIPAVVVSGVARADTVENNQRNVSYPHNIIEIYMDEEVKDIRKLERVYNLRRMPDLESHLNENMAELLRQREKEEERRQCEIRKAEAVELELKPADKFHYRRSHAWVAIIDNAYWSIKLKENYVNENGDLTKELPSVQFIEPSTGIFCDSHCKNYILIDSVWNNSQYYVNKQKYLRVSDIRWDLRNSEDWEHMLPGEPTEIRAHSVHSDDNIISTAENLVAEEKYLDTIRSWVTRLHIGEKEFEERFPQLQKTILYKCAKQERFSPYTQRDGKVMQLTLYADNEYKNPTVRWEYYENREDLLLQLKLIYKTSIVEESFQKGRNDSLKLIRSFKNSAAPKELYFYPEPRLDSLKYLEISNNRLELHYSNRSDFCIFQEFEFKPAGQVLKKIIEKFNRNLLLPADKDIAVRTFYITQNKISLKYHYEKGALTASTCEFIKPPKGNYGQEVLFNPLLFKFYKANIANPDRTPLELYRMLLTQLRDEEKLIKQFEKIMEEINGISDKRKNELEYPCLKFCIFDSLRNKNARIKRLQQYAHEEVYQREIKAKPADFLGPYLVPFKGRKLTYDESWTAYNACLFDLKSRFTDVLNDLQREYEDLTTKSKSLQRFLNKFENQFNNYDYEHLVNEAKEIGLNKRMVQQRLTLTHEDSQKKYEAVEESLKNDSRLNLYKN